MIVSMRNKRILIILITVILAFLTLHSISNIQENSKYMVYSSEEFHISLKYPKHWKSNPAYSERFEGEDGFFTASAAFSADFSFDEAIELVAYHKLKPFGSNPEIKVTEVQGHEARLILPSSDQPKEYERMASIIMKYPKPIQINGTIYYFFILHADTNHIESIADSLKFIY